MPASDRYVLPNRSDPEAIMTTRIAFVTTGILVVVACAAGLATAAAPDSKLAFQDDNHGNFVFDTGVVQGSVKKEGKADALKPVAYVDPNVPIDNRHGLFVPYRFLTPQRRYGFGSWEWPRTGQLREDGSAELHWNRSDDRPFVFSVTYRWAAADTLDTTVVFTPDVELQKFELFLGSYFRNFTKARAYVGDAGGGKPGFVESAKDKGGMQLYPRSEDVLEIVRDGRWKFPPYPNNWAIRPTLAGTLGMKKEPKSGVTVVIMAPPQDCFAVSMSQQEAGLGAFYLSLFGKDVAKGQSVTGHARMVFGKNISDEQAVQKYQEYVAASAHKP
jgi:hypothetical protein